LGGVGGAEGNKGGGKFGLNSRLAYTCNKVA